MRNASMGVLVFAVACGGTAVIDGGQGGDAGAGGNGQGAMGQGASGSANGPNTTTGVTSGPPRPACATPGQCCNELCDAVEQLPCWSGECECDGLPSDRCEDSMLALLQCIVGALPGSMVCSGTDVMIRCGVCEDEIDAVPSFCSGDMECAP